MLTFRTVIAALIFATLSAGALAQDVTVMISGGFKAALEKLTPQYEAQSGDRLIVISGPSMGKTPQAIPARLARGEKADVVIMVGDALAKLEQDRRTAAGSRVEPGGFSRRDGRQSGRAGAGYQYGACPAANAAEGAFHGLFRQRQRPVCREPAVP